MTYKPSSMFCNNFVDDTQKPWVIYSILLGFEKPYNIAVKLDFYFRYIKLLIAVMYTMGCASV